ncbi:MAG: glycosyltransferase family 1 protein [Candidatus Saccharibacteria bacterium]
MMSSAPTTIDVSHIMGWKGSLTGIERVEFNLINHYFNNTEANFICWEVEQAEFVDVDRAVIRSEILDRTSEAEQSGSAPVRSIGQRIKNKLKRRSLPSVGATIDGQTVVVLAGLWDSQSYIDGLIKLSRHNKLVHIVYDMIPLVTKGYVVDFMPPIFEKYFYSVLPVCTGVMAISKSSANDTVKILKQRNSEIPKVDSFTLGDDIVRAKKDVKPSGVAGDFILSVGTVEARKNHTLLYYAYKSLLQQGVELPSLVIAGRKGWLTEDLCYMLEHDEDVKGKILIKETITDSELSWLYRNCLFTAFPSFYEGWGLPVVESLSYGKVTLSSNTSSLTEAGLDMADYFSPFSTDELTVLIHKYLDEPKRVAREKLITKSYKSNNWQATAKDFADKVDALIG